MDKHLISHNNAKLWDLYRIMWLAMGVYNLINYNINIGSLSDDNNSQVECSYECFRNSDSQYKCTIADTSCVD